VLNVETIWKWLTSLPLQELVLGIGATSALLLILEERRLSILVLAAQYVLLALLVGPELYRPLILVRLALGLFICGMLYLTAGHVQNALYGLLPPMSNTQWTWRTPGTMLLRVLSLTGFGLAFRLMVVALGSLVAYGLWRNYPIAAIPPAINLVVYWLISMGLLIVFTSSEPLRMGLGTLTFMGGIEALYFLLENSFTVATLLNAVEIVLTLAIVLGAEMWLLSLDKEATP
jgi:hypothetical protein